MCANLIKLCIVYLLSEEENKNTSTTEAIWRKTVQREQQNRITYSLAYCSKLRQSVILDAQLHTQQLLGIFDFLSLWCDTNCAHIRVTARFGIVFAFSQNNQKIVEENICIKQTPKTLNHTMQARKYKTRRHSTLNLFWSTIIVITMPTPTRSCNDNDGSDNEII